MAREIIDNGDFLFDPNAEPNRDSFTKTNNNFQEIYTTIPQVDATLLNGQAGKVLRVNQGESFFELADVQGGSGDTLPVDDTTSIVQDAVDNTKQVRIEAGAISSGNTRVIIMPDNDVDLSQVGQGAGDTLPVDDTKSIVRDPLDNTKQVRIDAGNISNGNTRTIIMPDNDVDLSQVGQGVSLPVDDFVSIVQDPVDNTKQVRIDAGAVATSTTRVIIMPDNDVDLSQVGQGGDTLPVDDTTAIVQDPADNTKQVRIDAGAVATGTTRSIIMPDNDVDLSQVGQGGDTLPVDDTTSIVRDPIDNTKQVRIEAGAVATGTTRTITMPDVDVNLASVPTALQPGDNISELTNDAGFITSGLQSGDNISELTNDTGFITQDVFIPISEGGNNGFGTVFRQNNPGNYGDIGEGALDLTITNDTNGFRGVRGDNSLGVGIEITESGSDNVVLGNSAVVSGNDNSMVSRSTTVLGNSNLVFSHDVTVNGNSNLAFTNNVDINEDQTTALGTFSSPQANRAVTIGNSAEAFSFGETSVNGLFATTYTAGSTTGVVNEDRLFNIGKGDSLINRADAFTILKDNRTGIGFDNFETTTEASTLQVNGLAHSNATPAEIAAGTDGTLVTKGFANSSDGFFDSDVGESGLVVTTDQNNNYTIGIQKWQWYRAGNLVSFAFKARAISGGVQIGRLEMDFSGTTTPLPPLTSNLFDETFVANMACVTPDFTGVTGTLRQGRIRMLRRDPNFSGNSTVRSVQDVDFQGGSSTDVLTLSGTFRTTTKIGIVLAGQSNMSGRDTPQAIDLTADPRVAFVDDTLILTAVEPLHEQYEAAAGVSPGLAFGKRLTENLPNDVEILLIPTAVGATSISNWLNDDTVRDVQLLTNFTQKVQFAQSKGVEIKAVLWHQGEADVQPADLPLYSGRETSLFSQFRTIVGDPNLTIISGEIKGFTNMTQQQQDDINAQKQTTVNADPNAFLTDSSDFTDIDGTHYDAASERLMGQRMADVFLAEVEI